MQLAARSSTAIGVLRIPLTANYRWLRLQWSHELRTWQADWHQVVFSNEFRFNWWVHDDRIRVRRYAGERCLLRCVMERHSGLEPGFMAWGVRLHIMDDPMYSESRQDARPHVVKTVRDSCSAQHMQLLTWPVYSPDMSPILHVWDLVGWRLARHPRPAVSKDKLLLRIQAMWNSLPQTGIQNLSDCMPRRVAALIATSGGYTKH
ncbi:transposable element Tc1 transposase [Trichonephila clavipes]|nr:transposable element Tc1 transposase [Trichonephila clavipes]